MMKLEKGTLRGIVFLDIPLFLLGLNYVLYNAFSMDAFKMVFRVTAILLLLVGWFFQAKYTITKIELIAIFLAGISLLVNGVSAINFAVLIVFSICVTYPLDRISKGAYRVNVLLVLLMILLMITHVVNNTSYISTTGRLRYTLGFENPNVAALFYSSAVYLFVVSRKTLKFRVVVIALALTLVLYYYTNSRTTLLAMIIFCLFEGIYSIIEKKETTRAKNILGNISIIIVDALFVLNLVSTFIIEKFMPLDKLLSFRISTFERMINNSGTRGFLLGGTKETADNFYYMLLYQYSVVVYIFVAILAHFAMKKMVKSNNIKYISLLVGIFMVAMMESSLIRPEILVVLIVWKVLFSNFASKNKQSN